MRPPAPARRELWGPLRQHPDRNSTDTAGGAGGSVCWRSSLHFVRHQRWNAAPGSARPSRARSAFLTPTLVLFGSVLFQCMVVLFPWPSVWPVGIILGLCGLIGLSYQIYVILVQRKIDFASLDWLDWALFSVAPALGNASLIAGAAGLIAEKSFAPYAIAGAITLLLFAGTAFPTALFFYFICSWTWMT